MKKAILYLFIISLAACSNSTGNTSESSNDSTAKQPIAEEKTPMSSMATGCSSYYWFKEGTVAEYSIKDIAGNETSRTTSTVKNVRTEDGALRADFVTTTSKGNAITATYKCEGDKIYMDMKSFFQNNFNGLAAKGGMEMEVENAYLSFPADMKPGDELEGANFKIIAKKDGKPLMTTTNQVKDRKVESIENITTLAGSWNCLKITEHSIITSEMMGKALPGKETKNVYWFAPGVGFIKNDTYDKDGKLIMESELVSLKEK